MSKFIFLMPLASFHEPWMLIYTLTIWPVLIFMFFFFQWNYKRNHRIIMVTLWTLFVPFHLIVLSVRCLLQVGAGACTIHLSRKDRLNLNCTKQSFLVLFFSIVYFIPFFSKKQLHCYYNDIMIWKQLPLILHIQLPTYENLKHVVVVFIHFLLLLLHTWIYPILCFLRWYFFTWLICFHDR